ncbi:hypothetical protein [Pseudomaricurvus sp.]|uniref:Nmad3 family putative nucleotide modification protein n=1 Tax=Pseudomaricurvus sp. TaxID=2004510 RepID=UPI003F6C290E
MKIILSRKGFDSSSGGCPNPIFPDGSLLALPIPDQRSVVRYQQLTHQGINVGALVEQLTNGRVLAGDGAHLDPDLCVDHFERQPGWRPVLGQSGSAQGHLRKQGIDTGDLFLFFGLFRPVELHRQCWRFVPQAPARHIVWGWLQVGQVIGVDDLSPSDRGWLAYHPHCQREVDSNNMLYLGSEQLTLVDQPLAGAGFGQRVHEGCVLTDPAANRPSAWRLPRWFYPGDTREPLSFHHKTERWSRNSRHCFLQSVARGQEFVLDSRAYPAAKNWAAGIIKTLSESFHER